MDSVPLSLALYGLLDSILEPFTYGCAGYVISYRLTSAISGKIGAIVVTAIVFLAMDNIWPGVAMESAQMGMAAADEIVGNWIAEGEKIGTVEFDTGEKSGLWGLGEISRVYT
jgi:hypothetical protein